MPKEPTSPGGSTSGQSESKSPLQQDSLSETSLSPNVDQLLPVFTPHINALLGVASEVVSGEAQITEQPETQRGFYDTRKLQEARRERWKQTEYIPPLAGGSSNAQPNAPETPQKKLTNEVPKEEKKRAGLDESAIQRHLQFYIEQYPFISENEEALRKVEEFLRMYRYRPDPPKRSTFTHSSIQAVSLLFEVINLIESFQDRPSGQL